jgi:MFS family permease
MVSERTLDLAVDQGVISTDQLVRLRALEAGASSLRSEERRDDEQLRFIGGFGDVFVTIGIALLLGSSAYFTRTSLGTASMWVVTAALSWLLAEFFTLRRRMALPSIVLLLTFVGSTFAALVFVFAVALPDGQPAWRTVSGLGLFPGATGWAVGLGALVATGFAELHYWRFKVPITVAAGAATACAAVFAVVLALKPDLNLYLRSGLVIACGVAVFLAAMRFDAADPARVTRKTDVAFWLHLLAAPLIVQPLIFGFLGGIQNLDTSRAAGIIAVFLGLGLIAVIVDRRAILLSGLAYAGFAFGALIHQSGLEYETIPATLLALGVFVLALSAGWRPLRHAALRLLPERLTQRLPHPLTSIPS